MTRPALLRLLIATLLALPVGCAGTSADAGPGSADAGPGPEPDAQPDAEPDMQPDAEPDAEPDVPVGDIALEVGIGWSCFDPYVDGQPLLLQRGFQGGQHINTTVLATGLVPYAPDSIRMWAENAEGETVAGVFELLTSFEEATDVVPAPPEGWLVMRGPYLYVPDPEPLLDQVITLRVEIQAEDGRKGQWRATGVVTWMPDDYAEQVATWCTEEPTLGGGGGEGDG